MPITVKNSSGPDSYRTINACFICKNTFPFIKEEQVYTNHELKEGVGKCNSGKKISQQKYPGCAYGTVVTHKQRRVWICAICEKPTHTVQVDPEDRNFGQCVLFPQNMLGCGKMLGNKCIWCNHYSGYFMSRPGFCEKVAGTV